MLMVRFDSFVSICNVTGDRTYPSPDPSPSLRSDARDNPPDRPAWSAREQRGHEAGERVDGKVWVGRRVWVRHGYVDERTTNEARPRAGRLKRMGEEIRRDGTSGEYCEQAGSLTGDGVYYHIIFVTSHHVLNKQGPATCPGVYEVASFCCAWPLSFWAFPLSS
jgi:hypothetical protein